VFAASGDRGAFDIDDAFNVAAAVDRGRRVHRAATPRCHTDRAIDRRRDPAK
jgi:hypothetical protein